MMNYTSLGMKLGALLGGGKGNREGYEAAAKSDYYASQSGRADAEAAKAREETRKLARMLDLGSDKNMTRTALGLQGIDPSTVDYDVNRGARANMAREGMSQSDLNNPEYDKSVFPGLMEEPTTNSIVAVLRNALAGGDKNFDLGKAFAGIMKNQVGADLMGGRATPGQAAISGAALHAGQGGDPNKVIEAEALAKALTGGITPQALSMMKASPLFNSQGIGNYTGEGGQAFGVDQRNRVGMNDADNRTSIANNLLDNRTSIANNALDNRTSRINGGGGEGIKSVEQLARVHIENGVPAAEAWQRARDTFVARSEGRILTPAEIRTAEAAEKKEKKEFRARAESVDLAGGKSGRGKRAEKKSSIKQWLILKKPAIKKH